MEKRLVLSFALSFLVLYVWATLVPKPEKKNLPPPKNPSIERQQDPSSEDLPKNIPATVEKVEKSQENLTEEVYTLENEKFILKYSSLGAKLKDVFLKEYKTRLPISNVAGIARYDNVAFSVTKQEEKRIEFTYVDENFMVNKTYTIFDDYTLGVDVIIKNVQEMSKKEMFDIKGFTLNMASLDNSNIKTEKEPAKKSISNQRDRGLNEYVINSEEGIQRKNNAYKFSSKDQKTVNSPVNWLGFRNRYYCVIVKPKDSFKGYTVNNVSESELEVNLDTESQDFAANGSKAFSFISYFGPEKVDNLKKYEYGFENIQKYYKFGLFDGIAKLIDWMMKMLYKLIPNWGICIIIISIIIYYSMYPLTAKGMSSMRKMQALQPKIQGLKEKHEKNPQKLNQELLELYRKEKINPLGGCFPILLQMPVFIGLYQVLWRNVEFKGAAFLWIKDLSRPDRIFVLDFTLPIIGNEINLLPILMMAIMFFQQKFSAKNMTLTDPMQVQQQKMMATIMPVFLGFIFYKFASGLTLYFTMFYIFSTLTQWKISREPKVV